MDSDGGQTVEDRLDEDHLMKDASSEQAATALEIPQISSAPHTTAKFAPPSPEFDIPPPSTDSTTTGSTSAAVGANPSNTILETTEKPPEPPKMPPKKKGTAAVKKAPKRSKGGASRGGRVKKQPGPRAAATNSSPAPEDVDGSDDESDNGPYCICRGPDDHRFMISCDVCDDWFHGECIDISKEVGEHLIERLVCPNCTDGKTQVTLFKKKCAYQPACKKPARLYGDGGSVFCSEEHKNMWWEQMLSRMPRQSASKNASQQDRLTRDELIAILESNLAAIDHADGKFKISSRPFASSTVGVDSPESKSKNSPPGILTEEEEGILKASAADRYRMGEETVLCQKMLQLLDMANDRRKSLIASKKIDDTACGYDFRLDQVGVVGPFAYWLNSSEEAKEIFKAGSLDVGSHLTGEEKNICDKKRCKTHQGWFSIFTRDVKHLMKLLASDAIKNLENEKLIKEAAAERKLRREAEHRAALVGLL
ncbi:Set1 complex component spp1 [Colletotrichum musicola]|uniref:Set1 complex component spp1 n=1 Tax=Colletotrichum musicola TaxID=2175873 RepID=A0A8H6N879_9PEZI|nr:Set1 complex component spp1 [Colletotrichum musicola]